MISALRKRINLTRPVWVRGRKFNIPIWGGIEVPGIRSTRKTEVIARYVRSPGVFVDVGVNLGQTLIDVRLSHPEIEYIGFEPNPECVSYVRQLIAANRFERCTLVPAGLSDNDGLVRLYSAPNQSVDHASTMIASLRPNQTAPQFVATVVFDQVFGEISALPIAFVKIDVEGSELNVLRGMTATLEKYHPPIFCEILPQAGGINDQDARSRRIELLALVDALGYSIFHVRDAPGGQVSMNEVQQFQSKPFDRRLSWDYLFIHSTQT